MNPKAANTEVLDAQDLYQDAFAHLERSQAGDVPAWLADLRRRAMARFEQLGFPNTRQEEWRFTNVTPVVRSSFVPASLPAVLPSLDGLDPYSLNPEQTTRVVLVNGTFVPELSSTALLPPGTRVESLRAVIRTDTAPVETALGRLALPEEHPFVALNTAFLDDGVFVSVPPGSLVDLPIELLFVSTVSSQSFVAHPRVLVLVGERAQVRLVERYVGLDSERYLTNAVTEIQVEAGAVVDHYKVQQESRSAFHLASTYVDVGARGTFSSHAVSLGAALARHEIVAYLSGRGAEATLNGLYLGDGDQLLDNRTTIDHRVDHCSSHEVYKGILDGRARGVFNGKIIVRPDAQKTDAKQTNKALLLSDQAQINTKPQLEIFADDVKCTHGATVGQLDQEAEFYLRSRGLSAEDARHLLIRAFAGEVLDGVKIESLRSSIEQALLALLPGRG